MLTEKNYCDKDTAFAFQELGYNPYMFYDDGTPAIHLWNAQRFLRKEKKIEVNATYDNVVELHWHWYMKSLTNRNQTTSTINYDSYEQALLAGIKVAVKILKENEAIHE